MARLPVDPMLAKALLLSAGADHPASPGAPKTKGLVGGDGAANGARSGGGAKTQFGGGGRGAGEALGGEGVFGHMLSLVALLCADGSLFHAPAGKREAADEARNR
jgi:hypothetical protein